MDGGIAMKKMRIRIGLDGKTTIRVEGAVGEECLSFTKAVEKALGAVERRERTDHAAPEEARVEERNELEDRA
jgi:hypothetical protein